MINAFIINSVTVPSPPILPQIHIEAAQLQIKSLVSFSFSKLLDFQTVLAPFLLTLLTPSTIEMKFWGKCLSLRTCFDTSNKDSLGIEKPGV